MDLGNFYRIFNSTWCILVTVVLLFIRYLVDVGQTAGERLSWVLVILGGFVYAGVLIHSNFREWEEHPGKYKVESSWRKMTRKA